MIHQAFKPGQKVRRTKKTQIGGDIIYTVITSEPVFRTVPMKLRLTKILSLSSTRKEIINYRYRCKSNIDMNDFLQDELINSILTLESEDTKTNEDGHYD